MSGFLSKATLTILLSAPILLTGCGGGGDGAGSSSGENITTTPAAIDTNNVQEIAKAAGESLQVADIPNAFPIGISVDNNVNIILIDATRAATQASLLPAGVDATASFCSSGSADMTVSGTTAVNATVVFNNCTMLDAPTLTVTGTFKMHFDNINDTTGTSGFSFNFTNFKVTDSTSNTTTTMSMSMDCPTGVNSCVVSSDFVGADGVTHRVNNFNITGDATFGFNGTATFYHGTHGRISITANNITYGACGTYPDGGAISFSSSDGSSGTATFNANCTVSGTWNDGVSSGSF